MKIKLFVWTIAYFFTVNTMAVSVAISTDNDLQTSFSKPSLIEWFFGLLEYFGKLLSFQIEGFNPLVAFFIFYIPVLIVMGVVVEWIRGN
jgi:hypothetical protein